ncbi:nucleotide exchange factor GrpE [Candidatus Microgenomates bacterium]|nr:nucleotide exchange factor GrpE [Candidatus Microgenomates bacterium]
MVKKDTHILDLENQLKRALADYQNLEKRSVEQRKEWVKSANKDLLLRLLPVLDTLMLASQHVQDEGILASIKQFEDALKSEGVEKIETMGQEFNPQTMECVVTEQVDPSTGSGQEEGKVMEELQAGYRLHDKVLRPAKVKVGKKI